MIATQASTEGESRCETETPTGRPAEGRGSFDYASNEPDLSAPALGRRSLALGLGVVALGIPLLGASGLWSAIAVLLLGGVIATIVVPDAGRSAGRLTLIHWWPITTLLGFLAVTALGVVSAWLAIPAWATRETALAAWLFVVSIPVGVALARGGRILLAPGRPSFIVPSVLLLLLGAVFTQPIEVWARTVGIGTDFPRHAVMVTDVLRTGSLSYADNAYPRSVHSVVAFVQSAAGDSTYWGAWQSASSLLLILTWLLAIESALLASVIAASLQSPRWLSILAVPGVVGLLILTGPWVTGMLPYGSITSVEAGLIIVATGMLLLDGRPWPSLSAVMTLLALVPLMANTWLLLLPLPLLPAVWLVLVKARDRSIAPIVILAGTLGLVISVPVVQSSLAGVGLSYASTPGKIALPAVGASWLLATAGAVLGIALMWRADWRAFALACGLMLLAWAPVLLLMLMITDGTLDGSYYLRKTAWTPLGLLLGLGVPALMWALWRLGSRLSERTGHERAAAMLRWIPAWVLVVALVATQSGAVASATSYLKGQWPNYPATLVVPLLEQLEASATAGEPRAPVVVWGLSPYMQSGQKGATYAGNTDYTAVTALIKAGYPPPLGEGLLAAVRSHDPEGLCTYLAAHPESVRVTGPYPQGPLSWLVDSGCPAQVVGADEWMSIDIPTDWFVSTRYESLPYGYNYPTWLQLQNSARDPSDES